MSEIIAKVIEIKNHESLHIVKFGLFEDEVSMMSLELPNLKVGMKVVLGVKPINIIIAKNLKGHISFSNRLNMKIIDIDVGELLCSVRLLYNDIELESIMTRDIFEEMKLKIDDVVTAFIKASELSIKKILNV